MCNFTYFIKLKGVVTHFQDILNMLKCHKREVGKMLQQERHEQILARLNTEGKVKVKELANDFEVTEDCIRKDLTALEKEGLLKRIHGGAMQVRKNLHAYHVDERMSVRLTQKKIIAKKAVELIEENTVIFLGISTVNLELAKCIYQKNIPLTIVTNMIDIMQLFRQGDHHVNLIFIGGHFNRAKDGFIGALTIEQIHNYRFDLAFIGTVGMNIHDDKVTTYDVEDGLTKKEVMDASKKCYLVAENEKFELDGNYVFGSLSEFTGYIGSQEVTGRYKEKMEEYGLEII